MQKTLKKYRQFFAGLAVGVVAAVGVVLLDSSGSEAFETVPYVIRDVNGDTLFKTPKFSILYRGVGGVNAGSSMTIAGKNQGISSLWNGGYVSNWGGSDKGIENIALYDEHQGIASFFVAGQLFRVTDSGSQLRVANVVVPLSDSPLVIVGEDQRARVAGSGEVEAVLASTAASTSDYGTAAAPRP